MKKMMIGNEAVARGLFEAGCRVISSYPGTPSTEITEFAANYDEIHCEWAPNEKVAMEVAFGASLAGARSACAMKHVGLNVAADPLFTLSYTGVRGGLVVCVADDPGMHSSQNEQDSRRYAIAAKLPMLEPADSFEAKELAKLAFELSELYDTPVLLRMCTRIAHSQNVVELNDCTDNELKEYIKEPQKYIMSPANAIRRHPVVEERLKKLAEYAETSPLNREEHGDGSLGIITSGTSYQYVKEVFGDSGKVEGKNLFPLTGEFSQSLVAHVFGFAGKPYTKCEEALPVRPPVMCAGCPHRGMFYVLAKNKITVLGDIGCYTLGSAQPLNAIDSVLCMGASVSGIHGFNKARGTETEKKTVAVIGDSTFMHSGITGLVNIAYNASNSTVIILDNSITGMTGHQQNPTTGYNIKGDPASKVDLETLCRAVGIRRVRVVDPYDLAACETALREELAAEEPSVIISRRPCVLLKHVKPGKPLTVNKDKCRSCKKCMKLGCPAISMKDGKAAIDATLCIGCGVCRQLCAFGALAGEEENA